MARVSDDEVKKLLDTSRDVVPFIQTANLIVTEELVTAGMTDARLKQIELYLAAHLVTLADERGSMIEKRIGDSSERYGMNFRNAQGLSLTRFGQTAIALDSSGVLSGLASINPEAEFRVL